MEQSKQDFMKTRPVLPLLLSMAVPMMLSMLIQSLYNIVDSIFVSRLGTDALTAVSLVYPLQNVIVSVAVGIGVGISSVISRHLGAGNQEDADKAATIGMALTVFHSLLFVLVGLFVTVPFLKLFTDDAAIVDMAAQYGKIVLCFSFGSLLHISIEKIFQATGNMIPTMFLLGSGCIINIILDPILIFGYFGAPALGVSGAAIATVIGQIASFLLYIVVYKKMDIGVTISRAHLSFDVPIIKQIYAVGIPSSIMTTLPSILISILNSLLIGFSDVYVAVLGIYFKLQTFIYMPANGIIQGLRPIVGYNYGAHESKRMFQAIHLSLILAAILMAIGTVGALVFPEQILSLFDADASLMESGVTALRIISLGFLVSTFSIVYAGTFEALGKGRESLAISLLRQFIITIVLSYILAAIFGGNGIWAAFPIAEAIAAVAAVILFGRTKRHLY